MTDCYSFHSGKVPWDPIVERVGSSDELDSGLVQATASSASTATMLTASVRCLICGRVTMNPQFGDVWCTRGLPVDFSAGSPMVEHRSCWKRSDAVASGGLGRILPEVGALGDVHAP